MTKILPSNLAAQLTYKGRGNPFNSQPVTAISNCFPGLEFDFRVIWRRMFLGITLSENTNYVVEAEEPFKDLCHHRLLAIEDPQEKDDGRQNDGKEKVHVTVVKTTGTLLPGFPPYDLGTPLTPNGVSFMEWSNSLARIFSAQGKTLTCYFTPGKSDPEVLLPKDISELKPVRLTVRSIFEKSGVDGQPMATLARELVQPGELTQGLCSPWQNDYRECACYYWAASRPDYVNVEDGPDGVTRGNNWMAIDRPEAKSYLLDDRVDPRLWSYDQLFQDWQAHLKFVVGGSEEQDARDRSEDAG